MTGPCSRTRLYDGEQVDAYLLGKPVPPLPEADEARARPQSAEAGTTGTGRPKRATPQDHALTTRIW